MNVRDLLKQQWPISAYSELRKRVLGQGIAPATFDRTMSGRTFNFECWQVICKELELGLVAPHDFPEKIAVPSWAGIKEGGMA